MADWAWPATLAGVLAVAVYAVTVGGTYVYDDVVVVREDGRMRAPGRWRELLTGAYLPDAPDRLYRPVTSLSYAAQWRLHGDRAWVFHLVNILLHGLAAGMVAVLAYRLGGRWAAYIAGVLFAVHPVHVEAVANIVGRAEILCAIGTVGAVILFLSGRLTRARAAGIFACFLLALFSKEQGMLVPVMLGVAVILGVRRVEEDKRGRDGARPSMYEAWRDERLAMSWLMIGLCWGLAIYIVGREMTHLKFSWDLGQLDATIQPLVKSRGMDRVLVPVEVLGRYVGLMIAPVRLSPDYGGRTIGSVVRYSEPFVYIGVAALVAWGMGLEMAVRRKAKAVAFCLICLGLSYGMISNIPTLIGTIMAERLMYLPSVFLLIVVGIGISRLPRGVGIAIVSVLVILGSWRTVSYAAQWNDPVSFYRLAAARQPGSVRLPMLLAQELRERGRLAGAARAAAEARRIAPEYWHTWYLSAQIAMDEGRLDEADGFLSHAFNLKESNPMAVIGLRREIAKMRASATRPGR